MTQNNVAPKYCRKTETLQLCYFDLRLCTDTVAAYSSSILASATYIFFRKYLSLFAFMFFESNATEITHFNKVYDI